MKMINKPAILIILITAAFSVKTYSNSYYYYENFDNMPLVSSSNFVAGVNQQYFSTNGWTWDLRMSRELIANDQYGGAQNWPGGVEMMDAGGGNRQISLFGRPNNGQLMWNAWIIGEGIKFQPKQNDQLSNSIVNASKEEPFGYTIIRYKTSIDPRDNGKTPPDTFEKGYITEWLAEDQPWKTNEMDRLDNFIFMYDKQLRYNKDGITVYNNYGYYNNSDYDLDINTLNTDWDGKSIGNTTQLTNFRLMMDDTDNTTGNNSEKYAGGYVNPVVRPLGIKMTTDGSTVSMYVNFNPTNDTLFGVSNTWVLVARKTVSIANDVIAYFGSECGDNNPEAVEAKFDHFLVRSVTSNLSSFISPQVVVTNSLVAYTVTITNQMGTINDSGIGEIIIRKPSNYLSNWIYTSVAVSNQYSPTLTRVLGNINPAMGSFSVTNNSDGDLQIRFRMTSGSSQQIVNTPGGIITVTFNLWTPTAANSAGDAFEVYADCIKHADTGNDFIFDNTTGIKYATTGKKKSYPAGSGSLTVRVLTQPQSDADVSAAVSPYYQGTEEASYIYRLDTSRNTGSPDISSAVIVIPDSGFTQISNLNSLILGPLSSTYVKQTNNITGLGAGNFICINYAGAGMKLAGNQGFDKITFDVYGTATLPLGTKTSNYIWRSYVNSDAYVTGTTWQMTTNLNYNNQSLVLIAKSPKAAGNINPYSVAINVSPDSNVITNCIYKIFNKGEAGSDLVRVKIDVPADFTNVKKISSSWLGANTNINTYTFSNQAIWISYTNLGTGYKLTSSSLDTVTFDTAYRITNIDTNAIFGEWKLYGDNGNTEGFVPGEENLPSFWGMWIAPPKPMGENLVQDPVVYTSDLTNTVTNIIWNTSPLGVNIRMAKIVLPDWITNVLSIKSSHISNTAQNIVLSNTAGTNILYLMYTGSGGTVDGGGLLQSVNANLLNPDKDVIEIKTMDKIEWNSFSGTNYQLTNLPLMTYLFKTNTDVSDTSLFSLCGMATYSKTNYLSVEYPPVSAEYKIETNVIDSTTITNTLKFTINNTGLPGNRIKKVVLALDPFIVQSIVSANSLILGNISAGIASNTISADYTSAGKVLTGGSNDVITFVLADKINGMIYGPVNVEPSVYNDRESILLTNVISNSLGSLEFQIPKPKGAFGISPAVYFTGTNISQPFVITVSNMGQGTDIFQKAKIDIPAAFTNSITQVSSAWLGINTPSPLILQQGSNITIIYTNKMLLSGSNDQIIIQTSYTNTNAGSTDQWLAYGFNGFQVMGSDYYQPLTNTVLGDTNTYLTEQPDVNITPQEVLTTDLSNTFELTVRNGMNVNCKPILGVKVDIPYPYKPSGLKVDYSTGKVFSSVISNSSIYLTYNTNFVGNSFSSFKITSDKFYINSPTNARWSTTVFYGDSGGYRSTALKTGSSDTVNVVLPDPQAYASVSPKTVGKDFKQMRYSITITNFGITGNNIMMAKIVPPYTNAVNDIVTNISAISNLLGATLIYTNGAIFVNYNDSNTNIIAKKSDTISFTALDNQDLPGYQGNWSVFIANTTNTNDFTNTQTLVIGDLGFEVVQPAYRTEYRVTPNSVDTSLYQSQLSVIVNNTGGAGNDVRRLHIYLPFPFNTNGILINSLKAVSNTITNIGGTNAVELTYLSNVFVSDSNDTITLTVKDDLDTGNTNVWVNLEANYYTSVENFIASEVKVGTNLVSFQMPQPIVQSKILYNEAFSTHSAFNLAYRFINAGKGSNRVGKAWVVFPDIFTNQFADVLVSGKVTNTNWNGNSFEMDYLTFNSGETDTVVFSISNTVAYETNVTLSNFFYNGIYTNAGTNIGANDMTMNIINPPSASLESNTGLSTDYTNNIVLYFNNNSSGNLPIYRMRIDLTNLYTNVVSASSLLGSAYVSGNSIYISNYTGGYLPKNSVDSISLKLMDGIEKGNFTNDWNVYADNGSGFGKVRPTTDGALKLVFDMPSPKLDAFLETEWFYASTNAAISLTNQVRIKLINQGIGANSINRVRIDLPMPPESAYPLSNIDLSSLRSSVLQSETGFAQLITNTLLITYTNISQAGYASSIMDTVSFDLIYNIQDGSKPFPFTIYGNNGNSDGDMPANTPSNKTTLMSLVSSQDLCELSITSNAVLYTLDTNSTILYRVQNNSYSFGIKSIYVPFDTSLMQITGISSPWLGLSNMTPVFSNNGFIIDYSQRPIQKRESTNYFSDTLAIAVQYQRTTSTNFDMTGRVIYSGSVLFEKAKENAELAVNVPDFGRVKGIVIPGTVNPSIQFLPTGSDQSATNKFGTNLVVTADTNGTFTMDYIPEGIYDIVINSTKFKNIKIPQVKVWSNTITNIGTNILRNSPLNARDNQTQILASQQDSSNQIIVPPNSLFRNFSIDIWLIPMTNQDMQTAAAANKTIVAPNTPPAVTVYYIDMHDLNEDSMNEQEITNDITLIYHYNKAAIAAQNWSEDKLAIYYWRLMTKEWVRIGGAVDKQKSTVSAKVSYLHQYYAIFGDNAAVIAGAPGFVSVKTDPKVFTPTTADRTFKNIKISIGFEDSHDKYQVKIFTLRGSLVRSFERSAEFKEGEVYWDGKDEEGFDVKGGVYVYRITADGKLYSGTIVIVR